MDEKIEEIKTTHEGESQMEKLAKQTRILNDISNSDPFDKNALDKVCQDNNINHHYLYNNPDTKKKCMEMHERRSQIIKNEYESGLYTQQDIAIKHNITDATVRRLLRMCGFKDMSQERSESILEKISHTKGLSNKEVDIPASFRRNDNSIRWGQLLGFGNKSISSLMKEEAFKNKDDFMSRLEAKFNEYNVGIKYRSHIRKNAESIWYTMAKRENLHKHMAKKTKNRVNQMRLITGTKCPRWKSKTGRIFWGKFLGYGKKDSLASLYMEGKLKDRDEFIRIIANRCESFGIRPKKILRKANQAWYATKWMVENDKAYHKEKIFPKSNTSSTSVPHNGISEAINMDEYCELKNNEYVLGTEIEEDSDIKMDSDEVILLKIQENINMYKFKKISARDVVNRMKELVK